MNSYFIVSCSEQPNGMFGETLAVQSTSEDNYTGEKPVYHAAFHFLLDYVPLWELSYGRGGLIQYQSFLPKETALRTWSEMLATAKKRGLPPYLGVTKRHRPDNFMLTHAVDGFSLAMDFKVTDRNRAKLGEMLQEFDQIVLNAGGRFYFAKNHKKLGFERVVRIIQGFSPDVEAIRDGKRVNIELEYDSASILEHYRVLYKSEQNEFENACRGVWVQKGSTWHYLDKQTFRSLLTKEDKGFWCFGKTGFRIRI
jgi:hypothetical protein